MEVEAARVDDHAEPLEIDALRSKTRALEVLKTDPFFKFRVKEVDPREPRGPEVDGLVYRCMEMVDTLV